MAKIKAELLTSKERNICQKIAAREKGLAHKRAVALLSVGDGLTQTAAAKKSGLTLGQVRYALSIFRKNKSEKIIYCPLPLRQSKMLLTQLLLRQK